MNQLIKQVTTKLLSHIKSNQYLLGKVREVYLIGNLDHTTDKEFHDLDFAIFIEDQSGILTVIDLFSEKIINIMKTDMVFVSIFPIKESRKVEIDSMFILNTLETGIKVY